MIVLVFMCLFVFAMMGWYFWSEETKRRSRIMVLIGAENKKGTISDEKKTSLRQRSIQKDITKRLDTLDKDNKKKSGALTSLIAQTGMKLSVAHFWIMSMLFAITITAIAKALGAGILMLSVIFSMGLTFLPKLFLKMKAGKRQKLFLRDFADALEAMVRLLKAGMPVSESIKMVAREFGGPVGEEMRQIYEEQKIGISLPEATQKAAKRMPLPEMNMLATGITIQQQTGSSLSEALHNLANLIRARHRLKRKVVALSSEATVSAAIIGALPIFVGGMLYLINPEYTGLLFTHPVGKILSAGAAIWMLIGIFIMRQMINFKV